MSKDLDYRKRLGYMVFGFVLLSLVYRWLSGALLSQLASPVLVSPFADNFFWAYLFTDIPRLLSNHFVLALLFDLFFIGLTIGCLMRVRSRLLSIVLLIWAVTYYVIYHNYVGHHGHSFLGIIFMIIPFTMKGDKTFRITWEAVRYYLCFIFASAALWKIFRGSAFDGDHLVATLLSQHIDLLVYKPESLIAGIVQFLLNHQWMIQVIFAIVVAVQLSFLTGFFTKKYDRILLTLMVLFVAADYLVMRINFAELLIFGIALLPFASVTNHRTTDSPNELSVS